MREAKRQAGGDAVPSIDYLVAIIAATEPHVKPAGKYRHDALLRRRLRRGPGTVL